MSVSQQVSALWCPSGVAYFFLCFGLKQYFLILISSLVCAYRLRLSIQIFPSQIAHRKSVRKQRKFSVERTFYNPWNFSKKNRKSIKPFPRKRFVQTIEPDSEHTKIEKTVFLSYATMMRNILLVTLVALSILPCAFSW